VRRGAQRRRARASARFVNKFGVLVRAQRVPRRPGDASTAGESVPRHRPRVGAAPACPQRAPRAQRRTRLRRSTRASCLQPREPRARQALLLTSRSKLTRCSACCSTAGPAGRPADRCRSAAFPGRAAAAWATQAPRTPVELTVHGHERSGKGHGVGDGGGLDEDPRARHPPEQAGDHHRHQREDRPAPGRPANAPGPAPARRARHASAVAGLLRSDASGWCAAGPDSPQPPSGQSCRSHPAWRNRHSWNPCGL
jgi:hypothetical protein